MTLHIARYINHLLLLDRIYPKAKQLIHNSFSDPADAIGTKDEQLLVYCQVRDQIKDYMQNFAENNLNK